MDRNQFIIATAVALFVAFLLGWFASWLIHRLTRATRTELAEVNRLAQDLQDARTACDAAQSDAAAAQGRAQSALSDLKESQLEVEELREYIERKFGRTETDRA